MRVAGRCSWFNSKTLLPLLPAAILPLRNSLRTPWLQKDGRVNFVQGERQQISIKLYMDNAWHFSFLERCGELATSFTSPTHSTGFTPGKQVWQGSGHETPACPNKTVVGTLANHINMLLCSPEVEATFKKTLKNQC